MKEIFELINYLDLVFSQTWNDFFWPAIRNWWWVLPPFFLFKWFKFLWLWWRQELRSKKIKMVFLEIKLPEEAPKPIKAMEDVFTAFWAIYDSPANFREKWIDGKFILNLSLEICSFGGDIHFYIRTPKVLEETIKANIYSQYPEAEIFEVDDYTQNVPQDIPNNEWDLEGRDLVLANPSPFPIKTYRKFESAVEPKEEKRVDPLVKLLEGLSVLKRGEQLWIQIIISPITDKEVPWTKQGKELRDQLVKRKKPAPKRKTMIEEAVDLVVFGTPPGGVKKEEKEETIPPEMRLTPGEKEIVQELERKISKHGFKTTVRFVYLAKKSVFFKPRLSIPFSYFVSYGDQSLNFFKPIAKTSTKVRSTLAWYLDKRKAFLRKRKIFRNYIKRWRPFFPRPGGMSILNTEELASLFHFSSRIIAPVPSIKRVGAKKEEAPSGLPVIEQ